MISAKRLCVLLSTIVVGLACVPASAQWATQRVDLQVGWNAVFLEVQPVPDAIDELFADVPLLSIWLWNQPAPTVQFLVDPVDLVPEQQDWLQYIPGVDPEIDPRNQFTLQGGRSYLIQIGGSVPISLDFTGRPSLRPVKWVTDSLNLVGFHVDPVSPPTLQNFFADASAHNGQPIHRLDQSGVWNLVADPAATTMKAGEAIWVFSDGPSTFGGPLTVRVPVGDGLDYDRSLTELTLRVRNDTNTTKTITLQLRPSGPPPLGVGPPIAGAVAVSNYVVNIGEGQLGWVPLVDPLPITISPRREEGIRLAVRRNEMPPPGDPSALYQSLLGVSDGAGTVYDVPLSALGTGAGPGLWVGFATLDAVNEVESGDATPQPAASELQFRLIVHIDATGAATLLHQVVLMQATNPARLVLITDDTLIAGLQGVAVQDGESVGRRLSSAVFPWSEAMAGAFPSQLTAAITVDYNDPLNPFVHRFHPDHDNFDERFDADTFPIPEGTESYTFTRAITLNFDDVDSVGDPVWGVSHLGGEYLEAITGVHQKQINVSGRFRLNHVSDVAVLNDVP